MERVNRILNHKEFNRYLEVIEAAERQRGFCGHGLNHLLDVCRLSWILYLEEKKEKVFLHKEWIYAAGLLHDIGRWKEYEDGTDHALASSLLAPPILVDCGFDQEEIKKIVEAIKNHRNWKEEGKKELSGYLYRADKRSRPCFCCKAESACNWSREKKNMQIID